MEGGDELKLDSASRGNVCDDKSQGFCVFAHENMYILFLRVRYSQYSVQATDHDVKVVFLLVIN